MTRRLEEVLGLPPIETLEEVNSKLSPAEASAVLQNHALVEASEVLTALSNSDRIDVALTTVTGLLEHDVEMDDIAKRALASYEDLCDLGKNVPDAFVGKVFEVASTMLKTAMEAKDAKVQKKLKMLDLQIKKMKVDGTFSNKRTPNRGGNEFDRNDLIQHILDIQEKDESVD